MTLSDIFCDIRGGIFHLVCLANEAGHLQRIASGSGFYAAGHLITNFHVAQIPLDTLVWIRREEEANLMPQSVCLSASDFLASRVCASDGNNYDYSIHKIAELQGMSGLRELRIRTPHKLRIGDPIAFAGFPFEHTNLTCHAGIVSSFFRSGPANVIQLDASVNASNSGGPLFDPTTGEVLGIITRKATGLTAAFQQLRSVLKQNIQALSVNHGGYALVDGLNPRKVAVASNQQMLSVLGEIERQSNVGIGYAFSIEHLANENCIYENLNSSFTE